jgi:hypothetical protein
VLTSYAGNKAIIALMTNLAVKSTQMDTSSICAKDAMITIWEVNSAISACRYILMIPRLRSQTGASGFNATTRNAENGII